MGLKLCTLYYTTLDWLKFFHRGVTRWEGSLDMVTRKSKVFAFGCSLSIMLVIANIYFDLCSHSTELRVFLSQGVYPSIHEFYLAPLDEYHIICFEFIQQMTN